jgi:hypothetical protein
MMPISDEVVAVLAAAAAAVCVCQPGAKGRALASLDLARTEYARMWPCGRTEATCALL